MKLSAKYILAAAFVMLFCAMAPAASADSQQLVIGNTKISVLSSNVSGSSLDVTVPFGVYELGFGVDRLFGLEIPSMSLDFFSGDSTVPYEVELFSGVFVQNLTLYNLHHGAPLGQNNFTFTSLQTTYPGTTSVPEPSSLGMLSAGLAGLLLLTRKKLLLS